MAPSIHLLVNVIGGWKSSSNKTETWQWGVRFRASNVGAADVGTIPTDFVPVATNINRTESAWTITGNWKLQGPTLNNLNIDDWLNDQIAPAVTALMTRAGTASDMETREIRVYPIRSPDGRAEPASPYLSGSPVTLAYTGTPPAGPTAGHSRSRTRSSPRSAQELLAVTVAADSSSPAPPVGPLTRRPAA